MNIPQQADWELDFYSRPILEPDGKKRWELLITSSQDISGAKPFQWEKICPAGEVNSLWLAEALKEALTDAKKQGWNEPLKIRCWRTSMRTMIKKAASKVGLEVVPSRRTYSLIEWMAQREKEIYPNEPGYMVGPLAPTQSRLLNQAIPLPEAVRGDALTLASLPLGTLREAQDWPIEFSGLLPIQKTDNDNLEIPGLRLFSKTRALPLAAWLSGLEPVKLTLEGNQLLLEAGEEDRWLVTDLEIDIASNAKKSFLASKDKAGGLQFISVQSTPKEERFLGFWMLRDLPE